ncbi:MAG TPA: hypothetical protein VGO86_07940 [Candidatus Dormibacteraeota bacterium]|jgi:hypothetical protein
MTELSQTRALLAVMRRDYDAVYDALDALTDEELHALRGDISELELEIVRTLEGRAA